MRGAFHRISGRLKAYTWTLVREFYENMKSYEDLLRKLAKK
jgi:hypothetical protein